MFHVIHSFSIRMSSYSLIVGDVMHFLLSLASWWPPLSALENDMTDYLSLINEVCMEAKSADDPELLAEFLMQAVILGLQEKHLKADIIKNLQVKETVWMHRCV